MFSDMECLNGNFSSVVEHSGMPFGLSKNILSVEKNECLITIAHEKLKIMKSHWTIDVCRAPVHIKKTGGAVEVLKRDSNCSEGSGLYCKELKKIKSILQDDGLIFATGQKEDISNEHGKVFCSFLLIKKYLGEGFVFNRGSEYSNTLMKKNIVSESKEIISIEEQIPVDDGPGDF
jgi:hypothetical protein